MIEKKISPYSRKALKGFNLNSRKPFPKLYEIGYFKVRRIVIVGEPVIEKKNDGMREAISPYQQLFITFRYLATGNTFENLKFSSAVKQ